MIPAKSRRIGLMAKAEAARLANLQRDFAAALRERQAAEALIARLEALLDQRRDHVQTAVSVADLRDSRRLSDQIAAELDRNRARLPALQSRVDETAAQMARADHRKKRLDESATDARLAEIMEKEERAAAALPQRRAR